MSRASKLCEHDQSIGIAAGAVTKGARNPANYFKTVTLPQGHSACIGRDDEIKNHAFETQSLGFLQRKLQHRTSDPFSLCCGVGDEATITVMAATTRPIALDIKCAKGDLVFDDINMLCHPVCQSTLPAGVRVDGIGVSGPEHRFDHGPNGISVGLAGTSNMQNVNSRSTLN